jgi:hypothetical protein
MRKLARHEGTWNCDQLIGNLARRLSRVEHALNAAQLAFASLESGRHFEAALLI